MLREAWMSAITVEAKIFNNTFAFEGVCGGADRAGSACAGNEGLGL